MANLFVALPVPAVDGVGASVAVSAMGKAKTVTVVGAFSGSITIEIALDAAPAVFCPIHTFTQPAGKKTVEVAARFFRVRRIIDVTDPNGPGTPVVNVGSNDDGGQFVSLPVPAGNGVGASTDVSAIGTFNTITVGGATYGGVVIIEVSEDGGTTWSQCLTFPTGGGCKSMDIVAQFMRVRRADASGGVPTVDVGAINDPITTSSGEPGRYAPPEQWAQNNVAAAQTNVLLVQQVSTNFLNDIRMIRAGSIVGFSTRLTEAITDGTLTVEVTLDGAATGFTLVHTSAANPSGGQITQATALDTFVAGQRLGFRITTDAGFLPITTDLECWMDIDTD